MEDSRTMQAFIRNLKHFKALSGPVGGSQKPMHFVFALLPFDFSSAPYVTTKAFRPLVKY